MEQIIVNGTSVFYRGTGSSSLCYDVTELGVWFSDNKVLAETFAGEGYIITARLQAKRPVYFSAYKAWYNCVNVSDIKTEPLEAKKVLLDYLKFLQSEQCVDNNVVTLSTDQIWKALREKGYDAVIITNVYEGHAPQYKIPDVIDVAVLGVANIIETSRERRI